LHALPLGWIKLQQKATLMNKSKNDKKGIIYKRRFKEIACHKIHTADKKNNRHLSSDNKNMSFIRIKQTIKYKK